MGQHVTVHGKTRENFNGADGKWVPIRSNQTGSLSTSSEVVQSVPDFHTAADLLTAYGNFSEVTGNDFVTRVSFSNGQAVIALSADPINPGESRVMMDVPVTQPCALEVEASVIRNRQQFTTMTLFSNGEDGVTAPVPDPINIVSIYQSSADNGAAYNATAGTIVTVVLETALPAYPSDAAVYLSDWIHINGLVDNRLNYQNACIKFISADRKTITFGFADEAALPSLAIATITPTLGTAKVHFYNNMGGAAEGFGIRFTGTTTTSAAIVSVFGNGDAQVSGTLFGDHRVTIASSAPQYLNGVMGNVELKATSRYRLEGRPSEALVMDKSIDSHNAVWTARISRTAVKPAVNLPLYPRFRIYQPVGMSRPVASIVSISKSGTTTATVTTKDPHGLTTGNYVNIKGVRDQINFAAMTTPAAVTVTGANTFTIVIGSAVTATSRGGSVILVNGGSDQPGIIGQVVSSMANYTVNPDWIVVTGNITWSGLSVGDYINIHGNHDDTTGADVGATGAWEVANISTTQLIIKPIYDIFGVRKSPVTPALAGTVNCGGTVILRTTARVHDLMLEEWSESKVMIDGQGTTRVDKALPVWPATTFTVAGNTAIDSGLSNTGGAMPIAYRAQTANPTAVSASADAVYGLATMIGAAVGKPYCIPEVEWSFTSALTLTTDVAVQAAGGAGLKRHVTMIQATNTGATANDVILKDGTTARLQITVPAGQSVVMQLPTGIPLTANTALNVALSAAGTVRVNLLGYTAP